jgi:hypothetical protein
MVDHLPSEMPSGLPALIVGTTVASAALKKLIETIGHQVGLFLEPVHIRRKGQAEADSKVAMATAQAEVAAIKLQNKIMLREIQDRADERMRQLAIRRQQAVELIAIKAAHELPPNVSTEPVDQDWVAQFFSCCQDVNDEQMQSLWARILAGEVAKPGSFSALTLNVVRNLGHKDAELFTRFCSFMWWDGEHGFAPVLPGPSVEVVARKLGFADLTPLLRLEVLGLVRHQPIQFWRRWV